MSSFGIKRCRLSGEEMEVPELPSNIILDVLSRLPVKTLSKFKCVSKLWCQYISDVYFYRLHHSRSVQRPFSLLLHAELPPRVYESLCYYRIEVDATVHLSSIDDQGQVMNNFTKEIKVDAETRCVTLLHCQNGDLVCIASGLRIYICNPSTQEFCELPEPSPFFAHTTYIGFGYLPSTKEYKVVRLFHKPPNGDVDLNCEVLTISSTSCSPWRLLEDTCPFSTIDKPAFVNGSLHWAIYPAFRFQGEHMISFDLQAEKFSFLPAPYCVHENKKRIIDLTIFRLVEVGGNLWLGAYVDDGCMLDLWVMSDWNEFLWVKEHTIDLTTMGNGCVTVAAPISFKNHEEILIETVVRDRGRQLVYYNLRTKTFTKEPAPITELCYYTDSFFSLGNALGSKAE